MEDVTGVVQGTTTIHVQQPILVQQQQISKSTTTSELLVRGLVELQEQSISSCVCAELDANKMLRIYTENPSKMTQQRASVCCFFGAYNYITGTYTRHV